MSDTLNDYTNDDQVKSLLCDLENLQPEQRKSLSRLLDDSDTLDTDEKEELKLLLEGLDGLAPEQRHDVFCRIPVMLNNLISVFEAELKDKIKQPDRTAQRLVTRLANYFGGISIYLPTNNRLSIALRNVEIFNAYNKGKSIHELAAKYKLTYVQIYNVVRDLTKAERERRKSLN